MATPKAGALQAGDRVAYTAKFLKSTGQQVGSAGKRRGTVVGPVPGMGPMFIGIRWDDEQLSDHDADPEYREHVRQHGQAVNVANICKPRASLAFSDPG